MQKLETSRLFLIPLDADELTLFVQSNDTFEQTLDLVPTPRNRSENYRNVIQNRVIPAVKESPEYSGFYTIWVAVEKSTQKMVADLCFKGPPDANGEVEIGYATHPQFQRNGFMTEAIEGISNWALSTPGVLRIFAETDPENIASQKVLIKNNFEKVDENVKNVGWMLRR